MKPNKVTNATSAVERLQRLYGVNEMPPLDKPKIMSASEMALKINTTLSPESKQIVLDAIKKAIKVNRKSRSENVSSNYPL